MPGGHDKTARPVPWGHRKSFRGEFMKSTTLKAAIAIPIVAATSSTMLVVGASSSSAARSPIAPEASYQMLTASCTQSNGRFVAVGKARAHVGQVPLNNKKYYQKVTVQLDKKVIGGMWRKLEKREYSSGKFTNANVPTHSTPGVKSVVGPTIANGGTMSVKLKVTLKQVRRGPDKSVWAYQVRSQPFSCSIASPGGGGFTGGGGS